MHPMLAPEALRELRAAQSRARPSVHLLPVEEGRRCFRHDSAPAGAVRHIDKVLAVQLGAEVTGRLYRPGAGSLPVVLFFHGGGWVLGSVETHDQMCRELAHHSGCAVLSVDYRLAPEHPYPAAVEDALAALAWIRREGASHDIDATRVAVAGDSAGGNIAIALTLQSGKAAQIRQQVLFYPVTTTDLVVGIAEDFDGLMLCRDELRWHQEQYLPDPRDARRPDTSPLDCADLTDLPATLILSAECDPIAPQSAGFHFELAKAGVPVQLHTYDGMLHGFAQFPDRYPSAREALALAGEVLAQSLRRSSAQFDPDHTQPPSPQK